MAGSAILFLRNVLFTLLSINHPHSITEPPRIQRTTVNMVRPPVFTGRNPETYSVDKFIQDLELYYATADTAIDRKVAILDSAIHQPAKRHYDAKRDTDRFGVREREDADNANAAARRAYAELEYPPRLTWLRERYNSVEQQRTLRNQLFRNRQQTDESPRDFYNRVEEMMERAGIPVADNEMTLEQVFLQGLHGDIAHHVAIMSIDDLDRMVIVAQNYWLVQQDSRFAENTRLRPTPKKILARTQWSDDEEKPQPACQPNPRNPPQVQRRDRRQEIQRPAPDPV